MAEKLKIWLEAARPKTLPAAIAPVVIGNAMAWGYETFEWLTAICILIAALLIQIGTNYANDYFDSKHGVDTNERLGPVRVTQAGMISPRAIRTAFIVTFFLAIGFGLYLIHRGGWPILVIGILSILSGILYTAGPFPLGYKGLGDIFVLIFFGPVAVGGTYYLQTLQINEIILIAGLSPGLISTAILTVNNLRDMRTDRQTGKKTLAVRFGVAFAKIEYIITLLVASLIPLLIVFLDPGHPYSIIAGSVFLLMLPAIRTVYQLEPGVHLNHILATTGRILFLYSLLFSFGWIL